MAQNISPGVYVIEKDISQYTAGENTSIVGVVGFANKGPVNTPVLLTSREQLIQTFGKPSESIPSQAIEAGLEIMEVGNQLYFVRAAVADLVQDATVAIPFGACPAVEVLADSDFGVGTDLYLKIQVADNNGVTKFTAPKQFNIPAGTALTQSSALLSVLGGAADQDYVGYDTFDSRDCIIGMFAGENAYIGVSAYSDIDCTIPLDGVLSPVFHINGLESRSLPGMIFASSTQSGTTTSTIVLDDQVNLEMNVSSITSAGITSAAVSVPSGTYSLATLRSAIHADTAASVSAGFGWYWTGTAYKGYMYNTPSGPGTVGTFVNNPLVTGQYVGADARIAVSGSLAYELGMANTSTTIVVASGSVSATYYAQPTSAVIVYGATLEGSSLAYKVASLYPGAGYNETQNADGSYSGNSITIDSAAKDKSILVVNDEGVTAESFKVGLDDSAFYEDVINTGLTDPVSQYIKANLVTGAAFDTDIDATVMSDGFVGMLSAIGVDASTLTYNFGGFYGKPLSYPYAPGLPAHTLVGVGTETPTATSNKLRFNKLINGDYPLANGVNGYSVSDQTVNDEALIGTTGESVNTGIYALDRDYFNISVAIVPGVNTENVQNALIQLAESTQNFIALVAPPYGSITNVQQAIEWSNGRSETRNTSINSSFAAVYWPWVKVYSVYDATDRWYDPVIFAARQMCYNDLISDPWFAPAGFTRGRLAKPKDVEVELTQGDRDSMYSGGNIINPIVKFPSAGITIFGQRTAKRIPSALDRINVRRLMIYLRKVILNGTQSLVFEPNDPFTWAAVKNLIEPTLNDIKNRRGLLDYSVVCDESTNTPARIERGELWCKVVVRPTKSSEIITFELNVTNQSAKIG